ncbi:MAG: hypothetical protein DMG07_07195 [Acidobacteria bacterium]|nr:MAG: hypothetical protein DMG07_07195 [Acidobacteriota bacterium]
MATVIISPYNVVNFPEGGGHCWVYLQYVLGLRQWGCDVYWLEQLRPRGDLREDEALLAAFFSKLEDFDLREKIILYAAGEDAASSDAPIRYVGMRRAKAEALMSRADLLLNFHYAISPALLARFRRTALVDIDPGLLQFWISRRQLSVPRHDVYFTTGETVGAPSALFPDCGLDWIHIRPPVSLERWPYAFTPRAEAFTTVSNWDADDWIVDGQVVYENTKRVAFLEFADLPRFTAQPLELALFLRTERDSQDRRELEARGWRVRDSRARAGTPASYQRYIQGARGEFSCAKPSCLKFRNAWISDRSLCYLASGKPVVTQTTGPSCYLPNGEGLFRVSTMPEAAAALAAVNEDYERHSRSARQIAEAYFDSKQVAEQILSKGLANSEPVPRRPSTRLSPAPVEH